MQREFCIAEEETNIGESQRERDENSQKYVKKVGDGWKKTTQYSTHAPSRLVCFMKLF